MVVPTLKSVAKETGFSITTVSRALAGYDDVSAGTRSLIEKEAQRQGYKPNQIARQLRARRTDTIGMIIPTNLRGVEDDFFSILIKGVSSAAAKNRYDLLLNSQLPDADQIDAYHRIVGGGRVDGVILARTYQDDPRIAYLKSIKHPFVVSGRAGPDQETDFPYIDVDSQLGIELMVRHFAEYGHQHIGIILPPDDVAYTPYRLNGYRDGLDKAGLAFRKEYLASGHLSHQDGYRAAVELLDRVPELSAIVACNDSMALGAMAAVKDRGLQVGVDIAVGGFDDIPAAEHAGPPLTTISQPIYQIGEQLTEKLLQVIDGESLSECGTLLEPQLIIRESSGPQRR